MGTCKDPRPEEDRYYDPLIGAELVKIYQDGDSLWLHFSNGLVLAVTAEDNGFDTEIH